MPKPYKTAKDGLKGVIKKHAMGPANAVSLPGAHQAWVHPSRRLAGL